MVPAMKVAPAMGQPIGMARTAFFPAEFGAEAPAMSALHSRLMRQDPHAPEPGRFRTTRWSLVVAAGRRDEAGQRALAELCERYWPPVYAFLAHKTGDRERAADLTQGFFADLLSREDIGRADRERGRFRSFLLKSAQNFAAKDDARARALKRGGGDTPVSLEALRLEDGEAFGLEDMATPEAAFERRWAVAMLDRVMSRLADEYSQRGRSAVFLALRGHLEADSEQERYADAAQRLQDTAGVTMTETAVRVTVHRMRQRFRELLISEVSQTLSPTDDPMEEIHALRARLKDNTRKVGPQL